MVSEVALVVLLLVLTVFIMFLIPAVFSLFKTLGKLSKTLDNLNQRLPEILDHINEITDQTSRATRKVNNVVGDIAEFEQKISGEIKQPALQAVATISGILNGIQSFFNYFIRKKK
jgi:uncharacterized protein YoxC